MSPKRSPQNVPIALFGGTFNPVHNAHLRVARTVAHTLGCRVTLLPNATPPHKNQPNTTANHRLAMLKLACAPYAELMVDAWELRQPGPSWTLNTLQHWRQLHPTAPLVWIIGSDSFTQLHQWHQWHQFSALCHLAILPRPNNAPAHPEVLAAFPEVAPSQLAEHTNGYRIHIDMPSMELSSTHIRNELATQQVSDGLPSSVMAYIRQHGLYGVRA